MKKLLLICSFFIVHSFNAQTTLFEDSFETYNDFIITNIGDWITIDVDGLGTYSGGGGVPFDNQFDPKAFMVFNPVAAEVTNENSGTEVRNFDPRTGNKYMGCWAANGSANNDWLVSPAITLGTSGNEVKFYVKSMSNSYGLERYRVGIYIGSGTPTGGSDFTIISAGAYLTAPYPNWQEVTYDLDAYVGQTIRVGIHCVSDDAYFFMVDDFSVTTAEMSTDDFFASNLSIYPNPANDFFNLSSTTSIIENVKVTDLNGRVVKSIAANGVSDVQVNISDLTTGIYFVTVNTDNGTGSTKLVKK
ncbi:MAG: choice-of-anchor J domain-containing protein [Flavobacteriaceae bacterium]|jgi:hypothetical protein|nr:choice-of-anchor J domain-containing protein [Flavobacteriaceae bacterium]